MWKASLEIKFYKTRAAEIVNRSLQPDATPLPRGVTFSQRQDAETLIFECATQNASTLLATVDELLEHIELTLAVTRRTHGGE
jgi:tRNA threonylcarbamoyladenosine modification (KEOPS) complex  Pcc1 subunit